MVKKVINALILLVLCSGAAVATLKTKCPTESNNACTCEIRFGVSFTCSNLKSEEELKSNLDDLKEYDIDRLEVTDMNFNRPTPDLLKGMTISHLLLQRIEVSDPDSFNEGISYFQGLEDSLTILEITNSFKKERYLTHLKLDHMKVLESVMLLGNRVPQIGNDWFANGPKTVNFILFTNTGIESLGDKAFQSLTNLQILWLEGNALTEISRSMLPSPAPLLEKIDISKNKLKELPSDLFTNMPELYAVIATNNQIHTLSEDIWPGNLAENGRLYISGNPLRCDKDLKWLCKIKADSKETSCDSPSDKKGILLTGFCDMKTY